MADLTTGFCLRLNVTTQRTDFIPPSSIAGRTVHISDMLKVANFDTVDQLFKTADRIQKMHMSVDEITLLKALAFLSRGEFKNLKYILQCRHIK